MNFAQFYELKDIKKYKKTLFSYINNSRKLGTSWKHIVNTICTGFVKGAHKFQEHCSEDMCMQIKVYEHDNRWF